MTGFSRCELTEKGCQVVVEIRSLNNKFLDVSIKLPRRLTEYEDDLKKIVHQEISRGKIDVTVSLGGLDEIVQKVAVNAPLARQYIKAFKQLEYECGTPIAVKPEDLLKIEDLFEYSISNKQLQWVKNVVEKSLKKALKELKKHKQEEGKNLIKEIRSYIRSIAHSLKKIQKIAKSRHTEDYKQLRERIIKLVQDTEMLDQRRLELEIAIMAERFDVTEECVRIESHLKLFIDALASSGTVGRRLDFILQELNREANTISAKSNNVAISQEVVHIKEEIERLKEQVRNIE
jgi:uncharacterized protein (TIGR00255 family)